jgi:predicted PurR-regulated permease PerM
MAPKVEDPPLSFWAERAVGLLAIGAILFACFWIAKPLLGVLVWGALIAVALAPLHRLLARAGGNRPKATATVMVLFLLALVIFPLSFLPASWESAAERIAKLTNNWTELKIPPPPYWISGVPWFGPRISERWTAAASNPPALLTTLKPYFGPTLQWLAVKGGSLGLAILELLLSIILAGIFLGSGEGTTSALHKIANRLGGVSAENLLDVAVRTVRGVAQGVIGTALIQGILSGIGFVIAGVALWLFYQGETGWAVFTTVLGIIIGVLDNFLKPLLIGRGAGVPLWIIFIGVIGGILSIGLIGIFIGPLIMAAGYSIVTSWLSQKEERSQISK